MMHKTKDIEVTFYKNFPPRPMDIASKIENDNLDLKKCFNILNNKEASEKVAQKNLHSASDKKTNAAINVEENENITTEEECKKRYVNQHKKDGVVASSNNDMKANTNNEEIIDETKTNAQKKNNKNEKKDSPQAIKGQTALQNKLNFNNTLELRKSLTEQLCEEISMKLGRVFLFKSFLETYIYEKNPYLVNFVYAEDMLGAAKNKVLNALLVSSFSELVWKEDIYTHEYLLSKEILRKHANALEKIPDPTNYAIVPVFNLDRIKEILDQQEMNIKLLERKKLIVKKNNENLLFILNIIKNNFCEIKINGLRIVQRMLYRLNLLDKMLRIKNSSSFLSSKYEHSKIKLTALLDFFNSFNIDSKIQKINKNIVEIAEAKMKLEMDVFCNSDFAESLKSIIEEDEKNLKQMKATASEISTNLEENMECLYHLENEKLMD